MEKPSSTLIYALAYGVRRIAHLPHLASRQGGVEDEEVGDGAAEEALQQSAQGGGEAGEGSDSSADIGDGSCCGLDST